MYPMPIRQIPSRHPGRNRITGNNLRISQGPLCRIPEHSKSIRSPGNPVASQRSCNRPGRRIRKQTGISYRLCGYSECLTTYHQYIKNTIHYFIVLLEFGYRFPANISIVRHTFLFSNRKGLLPPEQKVRSEHSPF